MELSSKYEDVSDIEKIAYIVDYLHTQPFGKTLSAEEIALRFKNLSINITQTEIHRLCNEAKIICTSRSVNNITELPEYFVSKSIHIEAPSQCYKK